MAKKISVNMENGELVSIEVDGVTYASPDEITDERDRRQVQAMIDRLRDAEDTFDDEAFDKEFGPEFDQQFEELHRQSEKLPKVVLGIFVGVAVILLAVTAFLTSRNLDQLSKEVSAPGQVVELVERSSYDSETRETTVYSYPVVEFVAGDRGMQRVQLSEGSWPPEYVAGDEVSILYDPARPQSARIDSFSSTLLLWLFPGITGLIGVIFLGVCVVIVWVSRPKPAAGSAHTRVIG